MPHIAGAGGRFWCPCSHSTAYKKMKTQCLGCCRTSVPLVKLLPSISHPPHSNCSVTDVLGTRHCFPVLRACPICCPYHATHTFSQGFSPLIAFWFISGLWYFLKLPVFLPPYIVPFKVRFIIKLELLKFQGPSFRLAPLKALHLLLYSFVILYFFLNYNYINFRQTHPALLKSLSLCQQTASLLYWKMERFTHVLPNNAIYLHYLPSYEEGWSASLLSWDYSSLESSLLPSQESSVSIMCIEPLPLRWSHYHLNMWSPYLNSPDPHSLPASSLYLTSLFVL